VADLPVRSLALSLLLFLLVSTGLGQRRRPPVDAAASSNRGFRVTTNMVLIPVGVRDRQGRAVDNLNAEDFDVFDNGVRQKLVQCSVERGPRETVIVFDQSESMRPELAAVNQAVRAFVAEAGPGDKISVIAVKDSADVKVAPTKDSDQVLRELGPVMAEGRTALFDGVYLGLDRLLKARAPQSALLILSDGGDNSSRYEAQDLRGLALEAGAAVHSIVTAPGFPLTQESLGQVTMKRLAEETGGWHWEVKRRSDIAQLVRRLHSDPHYVLGYSPVGVPLDGRSHRVEVKRKGGRTGGLRLTWRRAYLTN
jgi:Ca-activated chloride channel homolog